MKLIYCLLVLLCPYAGSSQTSYALTIGNTLPDVEIGNMYNYQKSSVPVSLLKRKLTVIDFWSTWCGTCVASMPQMQAMQTEFGNQLRFLFVDTYPGDSATKVNACLYKIEQHSGVKFQLPYALQDTILNKFFPHDGVPHCVWLDSTLKVIAITGHDEVNAKNIRQYFSGKVLSLPVKTDGKRFDASQPLSIHNNSGTDVDFVYRSIITGYRDGLKVTGGFVNSGNDTITKMYRINTPLYILFQMAYPNELQYNAWRTFIETPDSALFKSDKRLVRALQHLYCYELTVPPVRMEEALAYLKEDLKRTFHATAHTEMRMINCYVLKTNDAIAKSVTKGGLASINTGEYVEHKFLRNVPVLQLSSLLEQLLHTTIVDETLIVQNIDIELPNRIYAFSPQQIISFLAGKGFTLTAAKRNMQVGVITKSNDSTNF